MRNRIPCTAERLSLLNPPMIQSVVEPSAYHIANQYLGENRVRIVEADEVQISAAVIGNSGLYEQTIRLKDGHLVTKCSCTLSEEPICRHSIAVLLEYHRWSQPRTQRKARDTTRGSDPAEQPKPTSHGASGDVKLSEIMAFVEWLQPAVKALERNQPLPDLPKLGAGEVATWIQAIRNLDERRRESEEIQVNLETDMRDREAYVARLTQQVQTSVEEAKTAQATCKEQQRALSTYQGLLGKLSDLTKDMGRLDGPLKTIAGELSGKGAQLESLAASFKEVAAALNALIKSSPAQ